MIQILLLCCQLAFAGKKAPPAPAPLALAPFQLVESAPVETTLNHADIPDAADVWVDLFGRATTSIDISEFYVSNEKGSRLEDVLAALEAAGKRGVKIRFLVDLKFSDKYPDDLTRLSRIPNLELRKIDFGALAGGVQHAKYFVVDRKEAYLGSQNFDWRSLEHIQELGVYFIEPSLVATVLDVFETDWAWAGGAPKDQRVHQATGTFPVQVGEGADALKVTPAMSPTGFLPDEGLYDLPQILALIDGAKTSVRVQLLNYKTLDRTGYWDPIDHALRAAAARGVKVQLLVADWSQKPGTIETLQSLEVMPNIDAKLMSIPLWSKGFVPFSRVVHAKYLVVDGQRAWLGTSNWGRDYFVQTRGVGMIVDGASFAGALDRFFEGDWSSPYAAAVEPGRTYTAPKISD